MTIFVLQQELYILTTYKGYSFIENFVKIFPIMFLISYELPEFFEQYFANKKMATYATGESVQDINRQEFASHCIFVLLLLVISAAQPAIFSALQVDSEYRAMFLLSTVLGIIGTFKSTVYSVFSLKQNYVYIMSGKMVTLMIHYFLFTFIYSFSTRNDGFNTWPSGFSKPVSEIVVHIVMLVVLYKKSIFSTKIHLDADQSYKFNYIPKKKDWKDIGKNLLAFFQYVVFFVSRPVVYFFISFKINKLTNVTKKQNVILDLFVYLFCQQSLSLIAKGVHSAIMTTMPIVFHQKQYQKMRLIISFGCLFSFILNEAVCAALVLNADCIFIFFVNKVNNQILTDYYLSGNHTQILKQTAFLFGSEVYQTALNTFAYISGRHYIPFVIGVLRIVGGVYFVINIDSALGQNASYGDVFFYFELLCTVLAVVFCVQAFISMFADYKSVKIEAVKEKKERKTDEFMIQ
ncbi:Hypothetical_protein [Hexamita inflata]|uniref:Hypothetical_protein n=1 Tax=Hexamita inflata TaxID=28002 RepID=A0AA86UFH2_9EUKA|nr:Hypothetical protein HINF_LOCUS36827 [Hexamita inflata]